MVILPPVFPFVKQFICHFVHLNLLNSYLNYALSKTFAFILHLLYNIFDSTKIGFPIFNTFIWDSMKFTRKERVR